MRKLQRIMPRLRVDKMQTYRIARPVATHTRPATCEEVGCEEFLKGWTTRLPVGSPQVDLLIKAARGEIDGLKRPFRELTGRGYLTNAGEREFLFEPGSPCFKATTHRIGIDRPEIYLVRGGDWRANTGLIRRHTKPEYWVEDMQETLDANRRRLR